ncbi:hypothetical protein VUR80DRAFT_2246 [Thermomyces stellatus]
MRSLNIARTVEDLRQTQSTESRSRAIGTFARSLRRDQLFQPFWDAVGGAAGLAGLMAEFSLRDVRAMCRQLGKTASAQKGRPGRHAGLTELVRLLHQDGPQRDPRPLRRYYEDIVPACELEFVREYDERHQPEWTKFQRMCLFVSYPEWYEKRFIQCLFPADGATQKVTFSTESKAFQGSLALSEAILSTLVADKEQTARIPGDFLGSFAMPLLKRLFRRRRHGDEKRNRMRDKFLYLLVQCMQVHAEQLADCRNLEEFQTRLLIYAIHRWSVARDKNAHAPAATRQQTELCLARLIEIMPVQFRYLRSLRFFNKLFLSRKPHVDSYQLLRLILRHAKGYELDLDDDTPSTRSRLRSLTEKSNLWPTGLFLYLDVEDAIVLFEKLCDIDVKASFLTPTLFWSKSSWRVTVLEQTGGPLLPLGDAEIVRCMLYAKSKERAGDPGWRARARSLVHERRKMAEESREWKQCAFWARAAVNLCVASRDLEMLEDTILWARRFNNHPLVVRDFYNITTFNTLEIRDLLSAHPGEAVDVISAHDRVAEVTKGIEASGRILLHLMETITMIMSQPHTQNQTWDTLLYLPVMIIDFRLKKKIRASFDALFSPDPPGPDYPSRAVLDAVWKPTIEVLLRAEVLLSANPQLSLHTTAMYVVRELREVSGGRARADLGSFLTERMKTHLGVQGLSRRMKDVVEVINGVVQSDQPWMAIPLIRDLVLDGEGADSAWHRHLLSSRFLSLLPHKYVSELLYTMADAIKGKMREQNSWPVEVISDDGEAIPTPSAVKVTTIKMVAQLLQGSQFIGASAACDILLGLLAEARHIDALVAIVNSLLTILREPTYSPEVHTRILDALEAKLSPILSRLNQRRPLSEEDWAAAESGVADLPDVASEKPLTSLLLAQDYGPESMSAEVRARLIRLLVRSLSESALHNARWKKLFLLRNGFTLDEDECLPPCPSILDVSHELLSRFAAYIPAETFVVLRDMALFNLRPTPGIARITAAVKADRYLVRSNGGKHWLAQFDNPGAAALHRFGIFGAVQLLERAPSALTPELGNGGGITVQMLADSALAIADRLISCELPDAFDEMVRHLSCAMRFESRTNWLSWRENCVPVLRTLTTKVDGLRSARGQLVDGESVPRVLPSSFLLRVSMLPVPYSKPPKEPAAAGEMDTFAEEMAGLLEWLAARRLPYHEEFAQLKRDLSMTLNGEDHVRAALRLARFNGGTRMVVGGENEEAWGLGDYLRLELAGSLLTNTRTPTDGDLLAEFKQTVRDWLDGDDELVRQIGLSVEKKHKAAFS